MLMFALKVKSYSATRNSTFSTVSLLAFGVLGPDKKDNDISYCPFYLDCIGLVQRLIIIGLPIVFSKW